MYSSTIGRGDKVKGTLCPHTFLFWSWRLSLDYWRARFTKENSSFTGGAKKEEFCIFSLLIALEAEFSQALATSCPSERKTGDLRGEQRVSEALHKERKRKLVFYPLLDLLT